MADASRFPQLAFPFTIVGAAAGWLSVGLIDNPLIGYGLNRGVAVLCATVVAALTGVLLKKLCVGRRYWYEMGAPDPESRPWTDAWALQGVVVVAAGAAAGALTAIVSGERRIAAECTGGGALCAVVFVPVCLVVIGAARRAQRARLGSIVAGSDRRAVWGILAILLAVTTLEALPDWPAWAANEGIAPVAVPAALLAAVAATLAIRASDRRAAARAQRAIDAGMSEREAGDEAPGDAHAPRLDLGLGDEVRARVARGAAAYRQRERTLALVKGSPEQALGALERAAQRGSVGLVVIGTVVAAHALAASRPALLMYQAERCKPWRKEACASAAELVEDPRRAAAFRRRARAE